MFARPSIDDAPFERSSWVGISRWSRLDSPSLPSSGATIRTVDQGARLSARLTIRPSSGTAPYSR